MAAWNATRVGIVLRAAAVEHRRQVRAAAEPGLGRDDEARVHVHRRHVRIVQVRDQRDARGPEARIVGGAGNFLAEFRRELAVHGRDSARRPSRTRGRASSPSRRRRPARRNDRCAATACARSGRLRGRASGAPRAARPPAPRTPRRCRRAVARTRRARAPGVRRAGLRCRVMGACHSMKRANGGVESAACSDHARQAFAIDGRERMRVAASPPARRVRGNSVPVRPRSSPSGTRSRAGPRPSAARLANIEVRNECASDWRFCGSL